MQQAQRARVPHAVHDVREAAREGEPLVRCPVRRGNGFDVLVSPRALDRNSVTRRPCAVLSMSVCSAATPASL